MAATPTSIAGSLQSFVRSHALATGISVALAAGVAGLGAGFAIAAPSPIAGTASPTAVITSTSATPTASVAARSIVRGLVGLTAKDTGQTVTQVAARLRQNETLNQIAGGQAATVVQAAEAAVAAKLSAQVASGKLTSGQAATLTTKADNRITQVMAAPGHRILRALRGGAPKSPKAAAPSASPSPSPAA